MIFLYFCKFFVPRSEGPPLTLYRPGDSQDYQSFDFLLFSQVFSIPFFFSELKCRDWMIIVKNFFCHCRNIRPVERYRRSSASSFLLFSQVFSIPFFFSELKCRDWMIIVKNFFCHCRNIRPVERYRRSSASSMFFFVEHAFGEWDIVVTMTVRCMCMYPSIPVCQDFSTSTVIERFQNNLTQIFSITCRCAIWNTPSGRPKVEVTSEGQIFMLLETFSEAYSGHVVHQSICPSIWWSLLKLLSASTYHFDKWKKLW